jgi:hypothetical protein
MRLSLLSVLLIALICAPRTPAQQTPKPPTGESEGAPADKLAGPAVTLEALTVAAKELPKGLALVEGEHCVSVQASTLFKSPEQSGILPKPVATSCQSFAKGKETPGSLLVLQYDEPLPEGSRGFVQGLIWGEEGPTAQHPEEIFFSGDFMIVLSFPNGSQAREWVADRLRSKCQLPLARARPELAPLVKEAMAFYDQRDAKGGLALLRKNAAKIKEYSFGQYLLGEFAANSKDWPTAESAYARAIELHDKRVDPLPNGEKTLWAALDGQASALLWQNKNAESIPVLQRSSEIGRQSMTKEQAGHSLFNLACAQARLKHFDEALAALTEGIELDEALRETALKDGDLAEARERPEFKELLAG